MNASPSSPNYNVSATFCATIADEWARAGTTAAFVSPGSRSTPLAVALWNNTSIDVHIFHDERSASFAALGHAVASGNPSVLACTSGTAAAHFYAAVLEASASAVPLLVCTADRPIELTAVSAPQTIDQTKLYGNAVRRFTEPGPPEFSQSHWWRSWASQLFADAAGWAGKPGPVHANLAFREPFSGVAGPLPQARPTGPWHRIHQLHGSVSGEVLDEILHKILDGVTPKRGLIVCGRGTTDPDTVLNLGETLGWPVLADHQSGARVAGRSVQHSDLLLRATSFANQNQPDVVFRFGETHASKNLSLWLHQIQPTIISIVPDQRWIDPERVADRVVIDGGLAKALLSILETKPQLRRLSYRQTWLETDTVAAKTLEVELPSDDSTHEPGIARTVLSEAETGSVVVVSSSMPVRDVEWYGPARPDIKVLSNRGTNGIDGVLSTAIGVALAGAPTTVLIGDVAFLHDSPALAGLRHRSIDLHIVIVDNDGGGIFSFLPQAAELPQADFEALFGTPHGTDLAALCSAHGLPVTDWASRSTKNRSGARVTVASSDRTKNRLIHDRLIKKVTKAIS